MRETPTVRLPRPTFRRQLSLDYGTSKATPAEARRTLAKALKSTARHAARSTDKPTELCLVGQSRSGADHRAQRRYWLRKARGWSAQSWPERLPTGKYAMWVAPLALEAAATARDHPKPAAVPIWIEFETILPPESALAIAVSVWLAQVAPSELETVALSPPILEQYTNGRRVKREVVTYGLD